MPAPIVRNVSPLGKLYVPALGVEVEPGVDTEIDDVDVARSLLAQAGVWEPANAAAERLLPKDDPEPEQGSDDTTPLEG